MESSDAFPCLVAALIAGWQIGVPERYNMRRVISPDGTVIFWARTQNSTLRVINKKQRMLDRTDRMRNR